MMAGIHGIPTRALQPESGQTIATVRMKKTMHDPGDGMARPRRFELLTF